MLVPRDTDTVEDLVGQQIGHLRILAPLGHGGMGVVYEARHEKLGRRVAVKVLREHERFRPQARALLLHEAQILSQLSHPNICLIHDYVADEGRDVVVLELVQGKSLRQVVTEGSLELAQKVAVAEQLLSALAAAHGEGIVHRDLKPENVMLTPGGQAKILDFGLAYRGDEQAVTEAQPLPRAAEMASLAPSLPAGRVTGTVDYMAPEQARGEPATPASDVYSLGVLLQELFTGKPARGKGGLTQRLEQAAKGESRPVTGVDPDLAALLERMKSLTPGRRPSALDALERLRWIAGKPRRRLERLVAMAFVAALAVLAAGMAWQAHRAQEAADRAEKAWEEAESLTAFMLEDLIERLRPLGRLDLLDQVADEAQRYYQQVPSELRSAERRYRHGLALRTLGQVLELEGRWEHAEGSYRKVLGLARELAAEEPQEARFQENLRKALDDLGDVLVQEDRFDDAEAAFRESLAISEQMVRDRPQDLGALAALADAWDDLGGLHQDRGQLTQAMAAYEESLDATRRLTGRAAANVTWQSKHARSYHRIGGVHEAKHELPLARAAFDETLEIDRQVAARAPDDTEHQMNLAQALYDVARIHRAEGNPAASQERFEEALTIDRRLVAQDPNNARWRSDLGRGLLGLGDLLKQQGRDAEARAAWSEARSVLAPLSTTHYRKLYEQAVMRLSGVGP
jgi:tetratricopeptide (TPR) repeat protein/tRNA A-37 threonylcarbamoyl transferase component Bud32